MNDVIEASDIDEDDDEDNICCTRWWFTDANDDTVSLKKVALWSSHYD